MCKGYHILANYQGEWGSIKTWVREQFFPEKLVVCPLFLFSKGKTQDLTPLTLTKSTSDNPYKKILNKMTFFCASTCCVKLLTMHNYYSGSTITNYSLSSLFLN